MIAAGQVQGPSSSTQRCYNITEPVTGETKQVCFETPITEPPKVTPTVPEKEKPKAPKIDYQYSLYCQGVSYLRDTNQVLVKLGNIYDHIFEAGAKVDHEIMEMIALTNDWFRFEDSPHLKWWINRGGFLFYLNAVRGELLNIRKIREGVKELRIRTAESMGLDKNDPKVVAAVKEKYEQKVAALKQELVRLKDKSPGAAVEKSVERTRGVRRALNETGRKVGNIKRAVVDLQREGGPPDAHKLAQVQEDLRVVVSKGHERIETVLKSDLGKIKGVEDAIKLEEAHLKTNANGGLRSVWNYGKAATLGPIINNTAFRLWLATWLSLSQILRGPDEIVDSSEAGRELTGWKRAMAYWGMFAVALAPSVYFVNLDYAPTLSGGGIPRGAQIAWSLWWLLYTGYQYGKVDQREALRMDRQDPTLADYPWNWTWDAWNPNRPVSEYMAWAADAVYWGITPRLSYPLVDIVFKRFGHKGSKVLEFDLDERKALFTEADRAFKAQAPSLWQSLKRADLGTAAKRLWIDLIKFGGKSIWTVVKTPSRGLYALSWWFINTVVFSIPLARVQQMARVITEGRTLPGVAIRPFLSSGFNQLFINPLKWAGLDPSMYTFYLPGMLLIVYPYNSCNEIPTAAHQLALTHLERYRWQTEPDGKTHEKDLFKKYWEASALENREEDIKKYQKILPKGIFDDLFGEYMPKVGLGPAFEVDPMTAGALSMVNPVPESEDGMMPEMGDMVPTKAEMVEGQKFAEKMLKELSPEEMEQLKAEMLEMMGETGPQEMPAIDFSDHPFVGHLNEG